MMVYPTRTPRSGGAPDAAQVTGLPDGDARRWRFVADTLEPAPPGIPSRLLVTWHAPPDGPDLPALAPGQVWRMALVLRRPADCCNAGLPDAEGRMFALGLRATGTVRGQPKFLADRPWAGPGVVIERARHRIRAGMRRALDGHRYAPVLIAWRSATRPGRTRGLAAVQPQRHHASGVHQRHARHLDRRRGGHAGRVPVAARALARHRIGRARAVGASWAAWRPPGSRCCIACSRAGACRPGAPSSCWRRCWRRPHVAPALDGRAGTGRRRRW